MRVWSHGFELGVGGQGPLDLPLGPLTQGGVVVLGGGACLVFGPLSVVGAGGLCPVSCAHGPGLLLREGRMGVPLKPGAMGFLCGHGASPGLGGRVALEGCTTK